jgi:hypothetical protein
MSKSLITTFRSIKTSKNFRLYNWSPVSQSSNPINGPPSPKVTTFSKAAGISNGAPTTTKTYASYSVYKMKAALSVKPIAPTFTANSPTSRSLDREGTLYLEFAPAGQNPREYNWQQKGTFSFDATECASLLVMDPVKGLELTHDPKAGTNDAGQTVKRVKLSPAPDGKGFYLNLTVLDKGATGPVTFSIMLTHAELEVIKSMARYCIPYFLGLNHLF